MTKSVITSLSNPWVKYARSLHHRRVRYRERAFLVESPRIIAEALAAGFTPTLLLIAPARAGHEYDQLIDVARARNTRVLAVSEQVLDRVTDTVTPRGLLAIFPFPDVTPVLRPRESPLILLLDGIQDPGNLGTLLRSALGAGAHAVYLAPGTTDPYAPKVVRAAAGSHFRLPIQSLAWDSPESLLANCSQRLAAEPHAGQPYDQVDWTRPSALLIGSEAHGLSSSARTMATGSVRIPLQGGLESLNAAVAGSVILFEAARQRRAASRR